MEFFFIVPIHTAELVRVPSGSYDVSLAIPGISGSVAANGFTDDISCAVSTLALHDPEMLVDGVIFEDAVSGVS